jgi:Lon protease-like protein
MPMNSIYLGPGDLPAVIPVFPLTGALLLPRGQMPLNIFEPRYLVMIDDALRSGQRLIGMIQPDSAAESDEHPKLYKIGCIGRLTQFTESGDGRYLIQLTGVARFRVEEELTVATPYRQCRVRAKTRSIAKHSCMRSPISSKPTISRPTGTASKTPRTRPWSTRWR